MNRLNAELKETDSAKARLAQTNIELTESTNAAVNQREEAKNVLVKIDEVRVLMNRLMGPNGSLTQVERQKFFPLTFDEPTPQQQPIQQ